MGLTLASIVRKWLSTTNRKDWEVRGCEEDANVGLFYGCKGVLRHRLLSIKAPIWIYEDYARYEDLEFKAVDPKFFTKLDRTMQFIAKYHNRYTKNMEEFNKKERKLLLEMLKIEQNV